MKNDQFITHRKKWSAGQLDLQTIHNQPSTDLKITDHLTITPRAQSLVCAVINIFTDESYRPITQNELSSTDVV